MAEHRATVRWSLEAPEFTFESYNRHHTWAFEGGQSVTGSASPQYKGDPAHVDPEEAIAASLSACHMLTFLAMACKAKLVVKSYEDQPVAHTGKNADGRMAVTKIDLHPKVVFETEPSAEQLADLHHKAHEYCFIANALKCEMTVQGA